MSSRVLSVFGGLLCLLAALLGPQNSSALAQNADDKPPDQQSTERNSVKEAQTVAEFAAQAYSRGRLVIRNAFGWGREWSVCSGATIWIPHSAISICTIGLAAPAIIYRRHSAVWS